MGCRGWVGQERRGTGAPRRPARLAHRPSRHYGTRWLMALALFTAGLDPAAACRWVAPPGPKVVLE